MRIPTACVNDVNDLICTIDKLIQERSAQQDNSRWWFRGTCFVERPLLPTVKIGFSKEQEKYLANEFYVRAGTRYPNCPAQDDYAGWLSLMQHYGLPTRLLDWSRSPLIAAYFAIHSNRRESDACIWAMSPASLNIDQGFEAYLYPLNAGTVKSFLMPALKGGEETNKVIAAMAVEIDPRMLMQQGAFTVHSSDQPLNEMPNCHKWLRKFTIPAVSIWKITHELDIMGFRQGDVFPDLNNLAAELKDIHGRST